ncbi:adipocyte plasma membrane-associated protein-like isoform X1 [Asterias rubens]|uniref:adipocyte plasma membrane-associated protein-like isoform X1 n=2 Tax=Asterias rubens TaxID=7604 RepID=UPI0014553D7E|nr:adipocyte plasma membrane-associated protein-like isoform X1 [Asterias rubens]XP_033639878.1 adipocyte plasma membrane-associated protein-like isoform X1 [Asterias rubens]
MEGARKRKTKAPVSSKPSVTTHNKVSSTSSSWSQCFLFFVFMVATLGVVIYLLPCPIDPSPLIFPAPPALEGTLAPNKLLQGTENILEGRLSGPEALEIRDGFLYTGTSDGQIVKIKGEEITNVARLGVPPCGLEKDEHTCGRPLGMRFHTDGFLYVLDAYLGIYKVNVDTGKAVQLLSAWDPIAGAPLKFLNDLDIQSDGIIYFTDSSQRWTRRENIFIALGTEHTGRLFRFNPNTREIKVLMDGLYFANGVQLSPDEDFLLMVETTKAKITRYYLKGPRKGQFEVFADNLPGYGDNVRSRKAGGYWLGLASIRKQPFSLLDFFVARPWLTKLVTKFFNCNSVLKYAPQYGLLIALDQDGNIIQSLHDPTGQNVSSISSVLDTGEYLYFGSYYKKFIGRLRVNF